MIVESIEIARRPEEVFAYLDELERHGEWQEEIVSSKLETEGPTRVGSRATDTRRMPGGPRDITYEIVEHDPPRKTSFRGVDGPVRVVGTVTVEPLDDGSRLEVELSWAGDAPQVLWAERIFTLDGEEMGFRLPLDLIRLAVARAPRPDDDV